jgi:hypothetical protein
MLKRVQGTRETLQPSSVPPRVRTRTSMRGLLVWAYKRELVRIAEARLADPADWMGPKGLGGGTGAVCRMLETGIVGGGPVARLTRLAVHPDAEWVHGLVRTLDRDEFWLVVRAAEADDAPEWNPVVPDIEIVPVRRANGKPRMIVCPVQKRPIACRLEVRGVGPAEAAAIRGAARARYRQWWRLLWALRERIVAESEALSRWEVTVIGAEAEPWGESAAKGG